MPSLSINGISIVIHRGQRVEKKFCKFCRGSNRRELAVATCNYMDGIGHCCGNGICAHHALHLGPDQVRCPLHNPDFGVYREVA